MQVLLRPIAKRYLDRLNQPDNGHIKAALHDLSREPPEGDIKPMSGQEGRFRLRVGGKNDNRSFKKRITELY